MYKCFYKISYNILLSLENTKDIVITDDRYEVSILQQESWTF